MLSIWSDRINLVGNLGTVLGAHIPGDLPDPLVFPDFAGGLTSVYRSAFGVRSVLCRDLA